MSRNVVDSRAETWDSDEADASMTYTTRCERAELLSSDESSASGEDKCGLHIDDEDGWRTVVVRRTRLRRLLKIGAALWTIE
jgi:hypothetical protein